jgi:DNA repair protein RadC
MEQTMNQPEWSKVAEVELVYKTKVKASERPQVKTSHDSYNILHQIWNKDRIEMQEEFKVLLMNRSNKVIGVFEAASGGITGTVADPRLILATALKSLATAIILAHTSKIKEAAKYHDITVLDHLIITSEGYFSFADEGLL